VQRCPRSAGKGQSGAAVVDFVLVSMILMPLVLGLIQICLVLYVRNSVSAAATEGARYAARLDQDPQDGIDRARRVLDGVISDRFITAIDGRNSSSDGLGITEIEIRAEVPPLGLWGPGVHLVVTGHGVREVAR